ncbi:hypothetical protein DPSP01_008210 [Paraphaeosphaeria sporulosa]|uniref:Uncharacterized protein n=1 Tax=Paraphaeosphaeria sporulosa TaxID=1460663 RepID=A0A177BXT2_9PLEO|nr:uncharacterized protein CC84DRAFT_1223419 [Paraphaeosphaeria sporulosa]OAF99139.1 hypothetical protein CC84DRAFT_1223419 [Paraphaeosphaeria sporulosa]
MNTPAAPASAPASPIFRYPVGTASPMYTTAVFDPVALNLSPDVVRAVSTPVPAIVVPLPVGRSSDTVKAKSLVGSVGAAAGAVSDAVELGTRVSVEGEKEVRLVREAEEVVDCADAVVLEDFVVRPRRENRVVLRREGRRIVVETKPELWFKDD